MSQVPVSTIAEQYQISREYVYVLQENTSRLLHDMEQNPRQGMDAFCKMVVPDIQLIVADHHFYEKMVVSLAIDGFASEEGIQRILENNFGKHISIGKISQILNQAADHAAEFDASVDLSGIRQGANDEIFQCGMPVLTGIDTVSTYVYLLQQEGGRSAQTWQAAMETGKARNLDLDVSINDSGTGLLSGIPMAFPDIRIQPDLFHWMMGIGKEIYAQEKKAYALLSEYYRCMDALGGRKPHEKTFQKLLALEEKLGPALERCDTLQTLYQWLREMFRCHGYSCQDVVSLCGWILECMKEAAGESPSQISKALSKAQKNLPDVLVYLKRAEEALRDYALGHGCSPEAFMLMYRMQGYSSGSPQYQAADRRIRRLLKGSYGKCYLKIQEILDGVKRASSLVENLNGRLRPYMNLKRMVPEKFLTLLKVYFNTKKYRRSRKAERVGKSPLELLTGQKHEDFYDIVCGR